VDTHSRPRGLSPSWWALQAIVIIGGSIYLAVLGSYGWLVIGIPVGGWMGKKAFDAQRKWDAWERTNPPSDDVSLS
jgi:hypothetical protein